jgi:hypothetical protein
MLWTQRTSAKPGVVSDRAGATPSANESLNGAPSWRWLVSSQAEGVFGPPVVCGPVGFVEPYLSRRWMALAPTLTYATS